MANYTLPSTTRISRVNRTLGSSTFLQASPFSGGVQSQDWGGSWWEYDLDFDVTQDAEGKALSAFLTRLRGPANTFTFRDPSINNKYQPGTILVKGAGQTGNTLVTDGWEPQEGNVLPGGMDFNKPTWSGRGDFTFTPATSFVGGSTAWEVQNNGTSPSRALIYSFPGAYTFTGAQESVFVVLENETTDLAPFAVNSSLGVWDLDTSSFIYQIRYDWSANALTNISGAGSSRVKDFGSSPNASTIKLLELSFSGVPGNRKRLVIYPTDTPINTRKIFMHVSGWLEVPLSEASVFDEGLLIEYRSNFNRVVLQSGDFISIGSSADARLYQVVQDATANTDDKESALVIEPSLRSSPADNAVVEVVDPIVALRPLQAVPNAITTPINYRFTMQARENI